MNRKNILFGLVVVSAGVLGSKLLSYLWPGNQHSSFFFNFVETRSHEKDGSDCFTTYFPEGSYFKNQCNSIMKFGLPGNENIQFQERFILSYSYRLRQPSWVLEKLSRYPNIDYDTDRKKCSFTRDPNIPLIFSSTNDDYKNSGYDRGHLAAAGNHKVNQESVCSTFFLSNISPQIGRGFNQNIWEQLESHTRKLMSDYEDLYVCTGILFLPQFDESSGDKYVHYKVIGENNVAVPTHYFKVILGVKSNHIYEVQSFVIPNEIIPDFELLESFYVPMSFIEKNSGLIFFNKVNRNDLVQIKPRIRATRRNFEDKEI